MSSITVQPLVPDDIPACESILTALHEWFGFEETNRGYIAGLSVLPAFVARIGDEVVGFLSLRRHNAVTTEIEVIAVARGSHRRGVGRALVMAAEAELRKTGARLLEVKTLGPSHPDEGYGKTRAFYQALGFLALDEVEIWSPGNPALILVKPLE